jgi:uncharacterized protein involved in exopolysaccharide biosynthesis
VEIRVFSENPHEAATIANAIAESYKTFTIEVASEKIEVERPQSSSVTIVDPAVPGLRPVRPNKPLNLVLGGLTGGALALGLGSVAAVITFIARKKLRRQNVVQ